VAGIGVDHADRLQAIENESSPRRSSKSHVAKHSIDSRILVSIVPALAVGIVFEVFLGHRHDYTGHFAAGYGGTLGAMMMWLGTIPGDRFSQFGTRGIAPVCIACIFLGGIAEATAFRIAKFDEIDFCSQSLGAVLAGIAALAYPGTTKPSDKTLYTGLITGIIFLSVGACFAVA